MNAHETARGWQRPEHTHNPHRSRAAPRARTYHFDFGQRLVAVREQVLDLARVNAHDAEKEMPRHAEGERLGGVLDRICSTRVEGREGWDGGR